MPADEPHLGTGDAAKYIGVSRRTLTRWIESGRIIAIILPSGRYRLRRADLDAVLANTNTRETTGSAA